MEEPSASLARAARETFAKYGVRRTTMADVAKAAGVVRQTVYNTVSGRDELVELAILQCCEELKVELLAAAEDDPDDIEDAMLAFLVRAVATTSAHAELNELTAALSAERVEEIFGHSPPIEDLIRETARPLLERAQAAGRLRPGATVDQTTRWLQGVLTFALLQDLSADPDELHRMLTTFALPSLLVGIGEA